MKNKLSLAKGYRARTIFQICNFIFMLLVVAVMLIPLLKVLVDSLDVKGGYEFRLFPQEVSFDAYRRILTEPSLYKAFGVSFYVTVIGTLLALVLSTMGAFVLTRKDMPGRKFFMYMMMFTMMFNGGIIPTYMLVKDLHLTNTLWAVILPLSINTYNLILLKNFFQDIPESLYESADLDGCSPMGIFTRIVLPMSKPAIAAIGLFYFVAYWNDWFNFTMYIQNSDLKNFQVKLREMVLTDDMGSNTDIAVFANTLKNATIIVAIIPVMIIYPFIQKYFTTGLNLGAVKG